MLLFSGCGKNLGDDSSIFLEESFDANKASIEVNCVSFDSSFTLFFKNGQVVKYVDSVDGELGQDTIDIINSEHLIGVSSNDTAVSIMNDVMKELDGYCEKK